tara:strand:- start:6 stop:200 length:195 start_codon:yes stop_codon:yes gene_type:complete
MILDEEKVRPKDINPTTKGISLTLGPLEKLCIDMSVMIAKIFTIAAYLVFDVHGDPRWPEKYGS